MLTEQQELIRVLKELNHTLSQILATLQQLANKK